MPDPTRKPDNEKPEDNNEENENMRTFIGDTASSQPPQDESENMRTFVGVPEASSPTPSSSADAGEDDDATKPSAAESTPPFGMEAPTSQKTPPFQADPSASGGDQKTQAMSSSEMSKPAAESPAEKPASFDPHATQFQQMQADGSEEQQNFDPHATQFQGVTQQSDTPGVHTTMPPSARPAASGVPSQSPASAAAEQTPPASSRRSRRGGEPSMGQTQAKAPRASAASNMGALPLWGIYAGLIFFSSIGLALFARLLVLLLVYTEFDVIAILSGIIGLGVFVLPAAVLEMVPQLAGAKQRLDSLESTMDRGESPHMQSVVETRATMSPWFIAFAAILVVMAVVGSLLATEATPLLSLDGDDEFVESAEKSFEESLEEDSYRELQPLEGNSESDQLDVSVQYPIMPTVLILGLFGAGVLAAAARMDFNLPSIKALEQLPFNVMQLVRPLATGVGLVGFAVALALISHRSGDFVFYFFLALIGAYGIAGTSWRILPRRLQEFSSTLRIALFAGVVVIALMSVATMFLDASSVEGVNIETNEAIEKVYRFAYSPDYFLFTVADRNIAVMSFLGILLVFLGLLGTIVSLQAFGYDLVRDKKTRTDVVGVGSAALLVAMLPTLLLWPLISLLGIGRGTEAWLLWGIPFVLLLAMLWAVQSRPALVTSALKPVKTLSGRLPASVPAPIRDTFHKVGNSSAEGVNAVLDWKLGFALIIVFSILALPLAISFWFWVIALIGVAFLLGDANTAPPAPKAPPKPPKPPKQAKAQKPESPETPSDPPEPFT